MQAEAKRGGRPVSLLHQSDRFMTDSSQKTERAACRRPPSALFHHESFMRGKITERGAKWAQWLKEKGKKI